MRTRTVVILGRKPSVAWDAVRDQLRCDDELVVLSIGFPVAAAQRDEFLVAQDIATEVGAWFDALLVTSNHQLLEALQRDDDIHLGARGAEGRRLRKVLAALPR